MTEAEQRKLNTIRQNVPKVYEAGHTKGFAEGEAVGKEVGYADGYSAGETEGREAGYADGKQSGYTEGYSAGEIVGKEAGYAEGYTKGETAGKEAGRTEGYSDGYSAGEAAGIEAAKKAEYDVLWDTIQGDGGYKDYSFFLSQKFWTKENFKPKYDIRPTNLYMFCFLQRSLGIDMVAVCEECGIVFDTSKCESFQYGLGYGVFTRLGVIDTRSAENLSTQMFFNGGILHTVEKLIVKESQGFNNYTFSGCEHLTNLFIEGTIGQNGLNLQGSRKLTHDSLMSILNALKDYSADTSGTAWIVTIGEANRAKLTEDELYIAEAKGWEVK